MTPVDSGPPAGFMAIFVIVLVLGIATTIYKVGMARTMARRSGMDPDEATAMTLLTDDGLEAAYLASSLRPESEPGRSSAVPVAEVSTADRLRELDDLRAQGLVTEEEYAERRREIIDSI